MKRNRKMKKLVFSSLALGTLAIAGATVSCPIAARAAEPMRLAEAEMDGITAGATLNQVTGGSVTGSTSATVTATQSQHGSSSPLMGGAAEITGYGVVVGIASGSPSSGSVTASAQASGDVNAAASVRDGVTVSNSFAPDLGKTVIVGVTAGAAVDFPQFLNK